MLGVPTKRRPGRPGRLFRKPAAYFRRQATQLEEELETQLQSSGVAGEHDVGFVKRRVGRNQHVPLDPREADRRDVVQVTADVLSVVE